MILYKEEIVRTPIHVPVQYPAYYQGYAYSSHFVAVFSDTVAVQICVVAHNMKLYQSTPANVFNFPPFEDFRPVQENVFLEALQRMHQQLKGMLDQLREDAS